MGKTKKNIECSEKHQKLGTALEEGLKKFSEKLIAETKKEDGYLILADKNGKIKNVAAKDL